MYIIGIFLREGTRGIIKGIEKNNSLEDLDLGLQWVLIYRIFQYR